MQRDMLVLPPAPVLNPLDDAASVKAVDYSANFDSLYKRIENVERFYKYGSTPGKLVRYIPGLAKPIYQGQISRTLEKKVCDEDSYRDLKNATFNIQLSANQYINFHNVHLVFPMKMKKGTDAN